MVCEKMFIVYFNGKSHILYPMNNNNHIDNNLTSNNPPKSTFNDYGLPILKHFHPIKSYFRAVN